MTTETALQSIEALEALLERERRALLKGDLDTLVGLLDEKRTLIETLSEYSSADGAELQPLREKAAQNQVLFDSALEGIRSVAQRMGALHRIRRSLETYDETGRKTTIETLR